MSNTSHTRSLLLVGASAATLGLAVYSDDFFTTSTFEAGRDTLFINRVEVLRGPQGTLYGRNAIGGAINIISNRPTHDFYAEGRVTIANFNAQTYSAVISGPLTDFLRVRLSGYDIQQTGGYFHNFAGPDEGGIHHEWYLEGQVEMDFGEHSQLWVKAFTLRFDNNRSGPGALLFTPITGHYDTALVPPSSILYNSGYGYNPAAINPVGLAGLTDNPALTNIRSVSHNTPLDIDLRDTWAVNVHWTTHLPGVDFRYVGGYNVYDYNLNGEWDQLSVTRYTIPLNPGSTCSFVPGCTNLTVYPEQVFNYREFNRWYSHEFLLSSTWDRPVQWIAGFFYFDEHYQQPTQIYSDTRNTALLNPVALNLSTFTLVPTPANPRANLYDAEYRMETRSTAIFGQVDWDVTPQWRVTGGLRYTRDHKAGDEFYRLVVLTDLPALGITAQNLGTLVPALDITNLTASFSNWPGVSTPAHFLPDGHVTRSLSADFSAVTGTAALQWRPNDDNLVYLRYSRGYKAGGFNAGAVSAGPETQPEHVNAYELGWNWTYGHTFQMQTALYYYDYQNAQLPNGVDTGGVILTQFFNIPKARSDGFELSALWRPIEPLDISVTYSFNDTSILSDCTLVGGVATGTCLVDSADPTAIQPGAHPVGPTGAQSIRGNALAQAPRNKFSINANYTFRFNPGDLILSASYIWKDESFASLFQRDYNRAPAWDQIDLRATWRSSDHRYEIAAFVRNLTDSLGYEAAGGGVLHSGNVVVNTYTLTPPRTYGVEFHYRFGRP